MVLTTGFKCPPDTLPLIYIPVAKAIAIGMGCPLFKITNNSINVPNNSQIYFNENSVNRTNIDLENWKKSPPVWIRRFGEKFNG